MKNLTILLLAIVVLASVYSCKKNENASSGSGSWSASVGTTASNGTTQSGNNINGEYVSSSNELLVNLHPSSTTSLPTIGFTTIGVNPTAFTAGGSYPLDGSGALTAVYTDASGNMYESTAGTLKLTTLSKGSNNSGTIVATFSFHGTNYGGNANDTIVVTNGTFSASGFAFQ